MMSKTQSNNENLISSFQLLNKNADSTRKHQTKKQIFGEIKNTIHNHELSTPFKQEFKTLKPSTINNIQNSVNRNKQQIKNDFLGKNMSSRKTSSIHSNALDEINLLDYFDFRGECCLKPHKSDQNIWSEADLYDDSFLNDILNGDLSHNEETNCNEIDLNILESEEEEIKENTHLECWLQPTTSEDDLCLNSTYLIKPQLDDFEFDM